MTSILFLFLAQFVGKPIPIQIQYVSNGNTICKTTNEDKLVIEPGKENICWEQVVQYHNETMNNKKSHIVTDKFLKLLAPIVGKVSRCNGGEDSK